ncbi:hypothetical protein ILUMI_27377 [Ignelater luminosus]|uniref:Uncharacterized protein n=1 Tax=Ignelater luminosus TaxID=2038154 RepID=A0A8K0C828_IGNLU|nr:hypothetical protein ILUMI_27377 [Ignelater luminosus]
MYELYVKFATEKQFVPVKEIQYRYLFCTGFNIHFQKPKKDRYDVCELNKLCTEEDRLTDEDKGHYQNYILEKNAPREERQKDIEGKTSVLTFDLQNVLTCPKAEISKFFYKSKLSVYNLTAHLSITKQVYCALWSEHLIGRKGNDLASAFYKILQNVIEDHPNLEEIILWSDGCVLQNRNLIMSFAIQSFLKLHPNLRKITMEYSSSGHSCVQDVDSVHSSIERVLCCLIKLFKCVQSILKIFINYLASTLKYNNVPFSKVVLLEFTQLSYNVNYKTLFIQEEFLSANLRSYRSRVNAEHDIFLTRPSVSEETNNNLPPKQSQCITVYAKMDAKK